MVTPMTVNDKAPQYMTSAELEEAIRRHREHTRKLLAEARNRRSSKPAQDALEPENGQKDDFQI